MPVAFVLQTQVTMANWVGVAIALSLIVIALTIIASGVVLLPILVKTSREMDRLGRVVDEDITPLIRSAQQIMGEGQALAGTVRAEGEALVRMSRRLRRRVRRGTDRVQHKLEDLEILYDVMYEEVEGAALDAAAVIRSLRRGTTWASRLRRALPRRFRR